MQRYLRAFEDHPLVLVRLVLTFLLATTLSSNQQAATSNAENGQEEFFEARIRPLFAGKCSACHTGAKSGGLQLDSRDHLLKGGNSGPAIVPGNPDQSLLIQAVSHTLSRLQMPLGGEKLKDQEIADLRAWIKMGAPWPEKSNLAPMSTSEQFTVSEDQKRFWSFQPLRKPPIPQTKDRAWPKSDIDFFVLAKLEAKGLRPVSAADKRTLIRRAYFDLIGLPPTPEEVDAFVHDFSPNAFAKVVDRLLASPHYGERWARYWLDVARYAEEDWRSTAELQTKGSYPNAFRYRDWVIQSLNDDLPYDLFVAAQIAGDQQEAKSPQQRERLIAATGFYALGPWYYEIFDPPQARADERHDRVDALTQGFLGLTVGCARCHNHKYDPISQFDYYALAGVFASSEYREYPLVSPGVVTDYEDRQKAIQDQETTIKDFLNTESDLLGEALAAKTSRYMVAALEVIRGKSITKTTAEQERLDDETLERWVEYLRKPEKDHPYLKDWNDLIRRGGSTEDARRVADQFQTLVLSIVSEKKALDSKNHVTLESDKLKKAGLKVVHLPNGFFYTDADFCPACDAETQTLPRDKFIVWKDLLGEADDGNASKVGICRYDGEKLDRFLSGEWKEYLNALRAQLEALKKSAPPPYPFVMGIADSPEPVNLRVNLRGSPYNLGDQVPRRFLSVLSHGDPVPFKIRSGRLELAEAIAHHPLTARVMVNRIWQHHFGAGIVRSPNNFGRAGIPPTHPELLEYLASQFVDHKYSIKWLHRQIMLSATYRLSSEYSERNFGEDSDNRLVWRANRQRLDVEALRDSILFVAGDLDLAVGGPSVELTDGCTRRTIYGKVSRFRLNRLLQLFDFPNPSITSGQRNVTNVPLQRLFFLNSDFAWSQAAVLAHRFGDERAGDEQKIRSAYRLLFGRAPTASEVDVGLGFLKDARSRSKMASDSRLLQPAYKQEGKSVGPPDAWTQYAEALLSSNEFIFVN